MEKDLSSCGRNLQVCKLSTNPIIVCAHCFDRNYYYQLTVARTEGLTATCAVALGLPKQMD